jgi:hypothetical protein
MNHTPTGAPLPWNFKFDENSGNTKIGAATEVVGIIYQQGYPRSSEENAEFIVRAVNAHDDLVAALEYLLTDALGDNQVAGCGCYVCSEHESPYGDAITKARAALAKAGRGKED